MSAGGRAWPAVIIGGAPRAGTSSLYDLLHAPALSAAVPARNRSC